jgi:hypothetical protein
MELLSAVVMPVNVSSDKDFATAEAPSYFHQHSLLEPSLDVVAANRAQGTINQHTQGAVAGVDPQHSSDAALRDGAAAAAAVDADDVLMGKPWLPAA